MILRKSFLKICSKFTGEHPRRNAISKKLLCNHIKITLWHGYSLLNSVHIFRTRFHKYGCGEPLLHYAELKHSHFRNVVHRNE